MSDAVHSGTEGEEMIDLRLASTPFPQVPELDHGENPSGLTEAALLQHLRRDAAAKVEAQAEAGESGSSCTYDAAAPLMELGNYNVPETSFVVRAWAFTRSAFRSVSTFFSGETNRRAFIEVLHKSKESIQHVEDSMHTELLRSDSGVKLFTDFAVLLAALYFALAQPYFAWVSSASLMTGANVALWVCAEVAFIVDVFTSMRTTFMDELSGCLEVAVSKVTARYLKTWFIVDVLAALPVDIIVYMLQGEVTLAFQLLGLFRLLKLFKIGYLWLLTSPASVSASYVYVHFYIIPFVRVFFWSLVITHWLTCIWIILNIDTDLHHQYRGIHGYIYALYWVLYTIASIGYGDVPVAYRPDILEMSFTLATLHRLFSCVMFVLSLYVNGYIVGILAARYQKADIQSEREDRMKETLGLMRHFDIPTELQKEVLAFQFHILNHNVSSTFETTLEPLPPSMQSKIGLHIRVKFVAMVPMFARASPDCLIALAEILEPVVFEPEDYIVVAGTEGHEMYFLSHGFADVRTSFPSNKFIATLKKGAFFGEIALLIETTRTASVQALTYCDCFRLNKEDFLEILDAYPALAASIREETARRQEEQERLKKEAIIHHSTHGHGHAHGHAKSVLSRKNSMHYTVASPAPTETAGSASEAGTPHRVVPVQLPPSNIVEIGEADAAIVAPPDADEEGLETVAKKRLQAAFRSVTVLSAVRKRANAFAPAVPVPAVGRPALSTGMLLLPSQMRLTTSPGLSPGFFDDTRSRYGDDTRSRYGDDTRSRYGDDTRSRLGDDTRSRYGEDLRSRFGGDSGANEEESPAPSLFNLPSFVPSISVPQSPAGTQSQLPRNAATTVKLVGLDQKLSSLDHTRKDMNQRVQTLQGVLDRTARALQRISRKNGIDVSRRQSISGGRVVRRESTAPLPRSGSASNLRAQHVGASPTQGRRESISKGGRRESVATAAPARTEVTAVQAVAEKDRAILEKVLGDESADDDNDVPAPPRAGATNMFPPIVRLRACLNRSRRRIAPSPSTPSIEAGGTDPESPVLSVVAHDAPTFTTPTLLSSPVDDGALLSPAAAPATPGSPSSSMQVPRVPSATSRSRLELMNTIVENSED